MAEAKTCEQYVLQELKAKQREVNELSEKLSAAQAESASLQKQNDFLVAKLNDRLDCYLIEKGCKAVVAESWASITPAVKDGKAVKFESWLKDAAENISCDDIPRSELVGGCQIQFREYYDAKVAEALGADGQGE